MTKEKRQLFTLLATIFWAVTFGLTGKPVCGMFAFFGCIGMVKL